MKSPSAAAAVLAALFLQACAPASQVSDVGARDDDGFFVRVFDGYFLIPSHYELTSYEDGFLRMLSPSTLDSLIAEQRGDVDVVWSSITIRNQPCEGESGNRRYIALERGEKFGLSYSVYNLSAANLESVDRVVEISDSDQCLVIFGDRSEFWRTSLEKYGEVKTLLNKPRRSR